ncbi:hypothetical protein [Lentibacillus sp. Marseille-P4043]|uniref:hypothetical protein n=1 Tax=Lentibacillus sp. Marseille-P4043 TaxID=2040293 RepID=UPI000D0B9BC6|nr:hypothetical protein [Lentibacillus sp. Marseille-P4043]
MIEITAKHTQIDSSSNRVGVFNGRNNIINWTAHSKRNRNVVYQTSKLVGNYVSNSLNVIDDRDHIDFLGRTSNRV